MSNAERTPEEQQRVTDLPEQQEPSAEDASQVKGGIIIVNSAPSPSTSTSPLATPTVRFFQEVDQ